MLISENIAYKFADGLQIEFPNLNAQVGEKIITKQDFIRRAEYTIRPDYCRQSNYIHKKII